MNYLKSKYFFIVFFIAISFVFMFVLDYFKGRALNNYLKSQTKEAKYKYEGIVLSPHDTSNLLFNSLINTAPVVDIFKDAHLSDEKKQAQIRNELYNHLKDSYKMLKSYNIQQLHFHLPNNYSFLRFHRPEKFGDDLTKIRPTVAHVSAYQTFIEGFEEGKIFNGYRFVYPMFDKDKTYIGSVEISHSIASLKKMYQRSFKDSKLNIVILKDVVKSKLFKDEVKNYEEYIFNSNFLHQTSMKMDKSVYEIFKNVKDIKEVHRKMNRFEDFSISVVDNNHFDRVSFITIDNPVTKDKVAYAVSFERSYWLDKFYSEYDYQRYFNILIAFLVTVGFYFASRYYFEIEKKAHYDSLMKIYNRSFFDDFLKQRFHSQKRKKEEISLIMFDIDYFKDINDKHGHNLGDKSLVYLSNIVKKHTRLSDVFARWGGEEFMILVDDKLSNATILAENLRLSIEKTTEKSAEIPGFTCSFGVVSSEEVIELNDLYILADERLYRAKNSGRNSVCSS